MRGRIVILGLSVTILLGFVALYILRNSGGEEFCYINSKGLYCEDAEASLAIKQFLGGFKTRPERIKLMRLTDQRILILQHADGNEMGESIISLHLPRGQSRTIHLPLGFSSIGFYIHNGTLVVNGITDRGSYHAKIANFLTDQGKEEVRADQLFSGDSLLASHNVLSVSVDRLLNPTVYYMMSNDTWRQCLLSKTGVTCSRLPYEGALINCVEDGVIVTVKFVFKTPTYQAIENGKSRKIQIAKGHPMFFNGVVRRDALLNAISKAQQLIPAAKRM